MAHEMKNTLNNRLLLKNQLFNFINKLKNIKMRHFTLILLFLTLPFFANCQRFNGMIDTLSKVYNQNIEIRTVGNKKYLNLKCDNLSLIQIEEIAKFVYNRSKSYYFKHDFKCYDENYKDFRDKNADLKNIVSSITENNLGYALRIQFTEFSISFNFDFGNINSIKYIDKSTGEYTISGVSNTTYETENFLVKTDKADCEKINSTLAILHEQYRTYIKNVKEITLTSSNDKTASTFLKSDCSTEYYVKVMTKNLKREDIRTFDINSFIANNYKTIGVGLLFAGGKALLNYVTKDGISTYTSSSQKSSDCKCTNPKFVENNDLIGSQDNHKIKFDNFYESSNIKIENGKYLHFTGLGLNPDVYKTY